MEAGERPLSLDASPEVFFALVLAVMVAALTLAAVLFTATSVGHPRTRVAPITTPSPALQAAGRFCERQADSAETYGVIEPVGIAQIKDEVFGTCMANRGFPSST